MKTAKKFKISVIIITVCLMYILKEELTLGVLHAYAYANETHAHRILGEIYSARSLEQSKKAAQHFQLALAKYKSELNLAPEDQRKMIEFIIGTHYECGRGTDINLDEAKKWYRKSYESGNLEANRFLQRVDKALLDAEKNIENN